uniref:DNA helicase Pif1-like 2B domain-containing protein n=1 Tax=Chenopodium quinoa TaxID=63459 RepID=A0A803N7C7_CHEQI
MRSIQDPEFAAFLLRVGDGCEPTVDEDMIKLPSSICAGNGDNISVDNLIHQIFPNLTEHVGDVSYMVQRAIITPTNDEVDMLNEKILTEFVGEEKTYYSCDTVPEDRQNLYQQEFLNSLSFGGFPPHILKLKVGSPIMLLRNIDTSSGLCNGTREQAKRDKSQQLSIKSVRLLGVPFNMRNKKTMTKIGDFLRIFMEIDDSNSLDSGDFMWIKVMTDIEKPLPRGLFLATSPSTSKWIALKYECLADFYFFCGRMDHTEIGCSFKDEDKEVCKEIVYQYGPWLRASPRNQVGREKRKIKKRELRKPDGVKESGKGKGSGGIIALKRSAKEIGCDIKQEAQLEVIKKKKSTATMMTGDDGIEDVIKGAWANLAI